jgi:hypothetical protein
VGRRQVLEGGRERKDWERRKGREEVAGRPAMEVAAAAPARGAAAGGGGEEKLSLIPC